MESFSFGARGADGTVVGVDHFGGVFSTFHGLAAFEAQRVALEMTGVRYPGGRRGEVARDINDADGDGDYDEYLYDISHDDLITVDGKGLSDVFAYAAEVGAGVTLFLPSLRYLDDPGRATEEVAAFARKLANGAFGELPELTIELGSETLDGTIARAEKYGQLADLQISALREGLGAAFSSVEIAIQMGRSGAEDAAIRAAIARDNVADIDAVIAHHLPINIFNHHRQDDAGFSRFDWTERLAQDWQDAVADARGDDRTDLHTLISAWTVGPSSAHYGVSEWHDVGARQGRTTIDTFVNLLQAGADAMHLWGVDARSNPNFFSRPDGSLVELSHGGAVFSLMAESLRGMTLHDGADQPGLANGRTPPVWVYAFEDAEKYVLFVAANQITGPTQVRLSLANLDVARDIDVKSISTRLSDDAPARLSGTERRLYEEPVFGHSQIDVDDESFDFTVGASFDIHRLTAWKDGAGVQGHAPSALMDADALFQVVAPGEAAFDGWSDIA